MRVGLIDVDGHNFPSLGLMKLSAYHKAQGDAVEWWDGFAQYDRVYMSRVFDDTYSTDRPAPCNAAEIIKGGTGYGLDNELSPEVEHIYPDYSLYHALTKGTAYGFLTRGCPRGCPFCLVAAKEGRQSRKVADLSEWWAGQNTIKLLDPNLLACPDHMALLQQLADSGAWVDYTQGLDARLLNRDNAAAIARTRTKMVHFAMDNMADMGAVLRGLKIYGEAVGGIVARRTRVYILTNYNTTHEEDMERVRAVQAAGCWPYIMVYNKPTAPQITRDLQRWSNNPAVYFATADFDEYDRRRTGEARP